MKKFTSLMAVMGMVVVFALALAGAPKVAQANHVDCGDTLTMNTTLDEDLICTGLGLIIGANNVILDLAGRTLTGDPGTIAVSNFGGFNGVTIQNGLISGFDNALQARFVQNFVVRNLVIEDTQSHAIFIGGSRMVDISELTILSAAGPFPGVKAIILNNVNHSTIFNVNIEGYSTGVALDAPPTRPLPRNVTVKSSTFSENFIGVEINSYVSVTVSENEIRNGVGVLTFPSAGIAAGSFGSVTDLNISNNYIHDNGNGILFDGVVNSSVSTNRVMDNTRNGIRLRFGSIGNRINSNIALGNDMFDLRHSGSSSPNVWVNNSCDTKLGADIPDC